VTARRSALFLIVSLALATPACGGAGARSRSPAGEGAARPAPERVDGPKEDAPPEPFVPSAGTGDVVAPFVRPERSSRLDAPYPQGRARAVFKAPFPESLRPAFLLAAGNRVVVVGKWSYAAFDTRGRAVETGDVDPTLARIDRETGKVAAATAEQAPPGDVSGRFAIHDGAFVLASGRTIRVVPREGEPRVLDGAFEALDVAIDDDGVAQVLVKQTGDLSLWSIPLRSGSMGRSKLSVTTRAARTPPILGKRVRVLVLDDRLVALDLDGRKLWERRGAFTGGASITSDDRLLVADGPKVYAIDVAGRASDVVVERDVVFVSPPILNASGLLLVASGKAIHAYRFE
jgi:hypothetical protein